MVKVSAVAFTENDPDVAKVLFDASTEIDPAKLAANEVLIQALALPVNPSDRFQIAGSYGGPIAFQTLGQDPSEKQVGVGGNEGCFRVVAVGSNVSQYSVGDWVILKMTRFGTWRSYAIVPITDENPTPLIKVLSDDDDRLSLADACSISVNPSTAYQLFNDYIHDWKKGDWIVTNAGNSFVNKYLFPLAKHHGVKTLGIIRQRDDFDSVRESLLAIGTTEIIADTDFIKGDFIAKSLPSITKGGDIRLSLDSLGGPTTPNLVACLSKNQYFVNYGGLAGGMVTFNPRIQLALNVTLKSYWLTRNTLLNPQGKIDTINKLLELYHAGVFPEAKFNAIKWDGKSSLRDRFVEAIQKSSEGKQVVIFE